MLNKFGIKKNNRNRKANKNLFRSNTEKTFTNFDVERQIMLSTMIF